MSAVNPFADHPTRRYYYAWEQLHGGTGRHLDVGCGSGEFLGSLAQTSSLDCFGVDAHTGYLEEFRARYPLLRVSAVSGDARFDFPDGFFQSASLLDVLEHVPNEHATLSEIHRLLVPDGLLVLTVPAKHLFSFLDPDNAKYHLPYLHRRIYTARFGAQTYQDRFVDLSNGMRGDISIERSQHTNYLPQELLDRLASLGFECTDRSGANLFWRLLHAPALLAGVRLKQLLERAILWDGKRFRSANLFLTLRRMA